MLNPHSLTPFPNAILFNWATVFILAFGNLPPSISRRAAWPRRRRGLRKLDV